MPVGIWVEQFHFEEQTASWEEIAFQVQGKHNFSSNCN